MVDGFGVITLLICIPVQIAAWYMIYRAQWLYDVNRRALARDPQWWRKKRLSWSQQYWSVLTWDGDKLTRPVEDDD